MERNDLKILKTDKMLYYLRGLNVILAILVIYQAILE